MKVLLDTNVVLDLLLGREPFVRQAESIFVMVENKEIEGFLCATSIVTLHYLIGKSKGNKEADSIISDLLTLFHIAPVNKSVLQWACVHNGLDYEDSVIYTAAEQEDVDVIVTRDAKGFKRSKVTVVTPELFLAGVSFREE